MCRDALYHQCYRQTCHCMLSSAHMLAAILGKDSSLPTGKKNLYIYNTDTLSVSMHCLTGPPYSVQWAESLMTSSIRMRFGGQVALVAIHTLLSVCNLSSLPPLSSPSLPLVTGADLIRQNKSFIQVL